ncbi:Hsp33 family molecular chaperone HslO [Acholeplasma sp. OttesenSCG-928-E16]|nr:Hsp33 family molecular chaperone HslO [Acholeplasma sp. OttesenSCG-928-E16]
MDYCLISTAYNKNVRIYVASTTNLVEKARKIHDTWPTASAALGRFLTISLMMGLMYKDDERLTIKLDGDGPLGFILADVSGKGTIRADIENPHVYLKYDEGPKKGKLNVSAAVGKGYLTITKDLNMKNYFTSSVEIVSGEIAEDFNYYFFTSEQTPSSVAAGVLVNTDQSILASGGFIIQALPNCDESAIISIEEILKNIEPISKMIHENKTPEDILHILSNGTEEILDKRELKYHCSCSKKKFEKALFSLETSVLDEMIKEDKKAEIVCNFCHKKYFFDESQLINLRNKKKSLPK